MSNWTVKTYNSSNYSKVKFTLIPKLSIKFNLTNTKIIIKQKEVHILSIVINYSFLFSQNLILINKSIK